MDTFLPDYPLNTEKIVCYCKFFDPNLRFISNLLLHTVNTQRVINQTISFMLAALLLVVAGARSWSDNGILSQNTPLVKKELAKSSAAKQAPESGEAKVSALALDAVITPAISFDFSHYFYFLPQPVWHFVAKELAVRFTFQESFFLFSYFHRIFGRFIVTNAP